MIKTDFEKNNPPGTKYPHLKKPGASYRCDKWRDGVCMYYTSQGSERVNKKGILLADIQVAEKHLLVRKKFDRKDFREQCPTAARNGGCAFTVIGRMLENSCNAEYNGDNGFVLRE